MRRALFTTLVAATLLAMTGVATAGGWAIASFDELPAEFESGAEYEVGYTILQHGRHPVAVDETEIRIHDPATGTTHTFTGVAEGPVGHYVAAVTFPEAGTWTWEASLGAFSAQALGTVEVQRGAAANTGAAGNAVLTLLQAALPMATVLSAGWLLVLMGRRTVPDAS